MRPGQKVEERDFAMVSMGDGKGGEAMVELLQKRRSTAPRAVTLTIAATGGTSEGFKYEICPVEVNVTVLLWWLWLWLLWL